METKTISAFIDINENSKIIEKIKLLTNFEKINFKKADHQAQAERDWEENSQKGHSSSSQALGFGIQGQDKEQKEPHGLQILTWSEVLKPSKLKGTDVYTYKLNLNKPHFYS